MAIITIREKLVRLLGKKKNQSEAETPQAISGVNSSEKNKKILMFVVLFLVAVAAGVGLFVLGDSDESTDDAAVTVEPLAVCATDEKREMLIRAAGVLLPSQNLELGPIVEEIEQLEDYDRDPNCLVVTTIYYVNISNADKARENLDKLNGVYNAETGYDSAFVGAEVRNPESLYPLVGNVEQAREAIKANDIQSPEIEE